MQRHPFFLKLVLIVAFHHNIGKETNHPGTSVPNRLPSHFLLVTLLQECVWVTHRSQSFPFVSQDTVTCYQTSRMFPSLLYKECSMLSWQAVFPYFMTQFAVVSGFPESTQNFLNVFTSTHGESGVLVLSFSVILVKVAFHHYPCLLTQRAKHLLCSLSI